MLSRVDCTLFLWGGVNVLLLHLFFHFRAAVGLVCSGLINILMQAYRASLVSPNTGGCEQAICSVCNHHTPETATKTGLKHQPSSPTLSVETGRNVPESEVCELNAPDFSFQIHRAPTANFPSQVHLGPASAVGQNATGCGLA